MSFITGAPTTNYSEDYENSSGPFTPCDGSDDNNDGIYVSPINGSWSGEANRDFIVSGASNTEDFGGSPRRGNRLELYIRFEPGSSVLAGDDHVRYSFQTANGNLVGYLENNANGLEWRTDNNSTTNIWSSYSQENMDVRFDLDYNNSQVRITIDGTVEGTFDANQDITGDDSLDQQQLGFNNNNSDFTVIGVVDDITVSNF